MHGKKLALIQLSLDRFQPAYIDQGHAKASQNLLAQTLKSQLQELSLKLPQSPTNQARASAGIVMEPARNGMDGARLMVLATGDAHGAEGQVLLSDRNDDTKKGAITLPFLCHHSSPIKRNNAQAKTPSAARCANLHFFFWLATMWANIFEKVVISAHLLSAFDSCIITKYSNK